MTAFFAVFSTCTEQKAPFVDGSNRSKDRVNQAKEIHGPY
jgi:hypothetical protein